MNINRDKIVQLVDTDTIENLTSALSQRLIADQLRLTTAESCTGGKLASARCRRNWQQEWQPVPYSVRMLMSVLPLPATADRRAVKMVRQRVPSGLRGILKARTTLRLCILLATAKRY